VRRNMTGLLGRGQRTFSAFTAAQKVITVLAVAGLLLGTLMFSRWATKPTYAPLFTNLAPADASAIVDALNSSGTPYQLSNGGATVLVPQQQVYDTRIALSGKGIAPSSGGSGWSLLDKQGVTASKFQQQVAYRRALEGELSATISAIDGVNAAVVHLAIPEKDVFTRESDKAKASVLVETAPGKDLTSGQVQAVVNLVASSVEGMEPAEVTVADDSGKVLSASADGSPGAAADSRAQQTRDYETRVASSLQAMIDRVVGAGHSEVRLTADLDFDQTHTTTEKFTDSAVKPSASSKTSESFTGTGATTGGALGGVLGPDNINVPAGAGGGTSRYTKTTSTDNNALDRVVEERKSAPGAVRKLNVAVLLDTKTSGEVKPAQIEALVASAVGLDTERGDTVVVDQLPFDETAAKKAEEELSAAKKAEAAAQRNDLVKTAGKTLLVLLALGWAVLYGRKRAQRTALAAAERKAELAQLEALQRSLEAPTEALALAGGPGAEGYPERRGQVPAQVPAATLAAREDVTELVKAQPEEVAQLLRGWLADRRG
jgi:flagellar M-ring protein FliF